MEGSHLDKDLHTDFTLSIQSPAGRDESREDKATIKCETSPPSSPRTLRLEKLGHPTLSQEEGKRYRGLARMGRKGSAYCWWPSILNSTGRVGRSNVIEKNLFCIEKIETEKWHMENGGG